MHASRILRLYTFDDDAKRRRTPVRAAPKELGACAERVAIDGDPGACAQLGTAQ
jgi:hypothetical protein